MKLTNLFLILSLSAVSAMAQPVIKNYSFENWSDSMGKKYPTNWECDTFLMKNDIVKRVSPGSQGTYAVHLGSYFFSGQVWGAQIEYNDTLTSRPGSLLFDYKEFNNNTSFVNGLTVKVYLYDSVGDYLDDFAWYSSGNQSSFKAATLPLPFSSNPRPAYVLINLYYFNYGGATNEYCIVDNLRFQNWVNGIDINPVNTFRTYPNPAGNRISIDCNDGQEIGKAELICADGRIIQVQISDNSIDVSALSQGIYTLVLYNPDGTLFGRNSVRIMH